MVVAKIIVIAFSAATSLLIGCSSIENERPSSVQSSNFFWQAEAQSGWEQVKLPGKRNTDYYLVALHGQNTLKANAQSSASMLRKKIRIEPDALNSLLFSWQVP